MITCVVWASFSTGRYMATRSVLQDRDETIKSVANSRIDTNFSYTIANAQPRALGPVSSAYSLPLTDPAYTLSAVTHDKLFARIALLENRVQELKTVNADIIQTVREKTQNKILNMEEIIRQTGLNTDGLKNEAQKAMRKEQAPSEADASKRFPAQGGPFIPAETAPTGALSQELDMKLNHLALLNSIVERLPIGMPIATAERHSNYGRRIDPFTGRLAFHAGVDMSGPSGSKIKSTGDGVVVRAGWDGAYGNAVDVSHGFGITTRYAHMSAISVSAGDVVKKGQVLGVQGSTGRSTGAHLHYEVRQYDRPIDPSNLIHMSANVSQE
jgi:murein DD-endopeptidase MepM/ murein hydrolase activator NlpD